LEPARHELRAARTLLVHERLEIAPERLVELACLHLGHLHAHAADCLVEACAHEPDGVVLDALVELLDAELLGQAVEELEERAVRDGAAKLGIDFGSSSLSTNHADEQSAKRSSSVTLNVRRVPSCSSTSGETSRVGRRNA